MEVGLWPLVEHFLDSYEAAGLAVAVVSDEEVVARGFGVRDVRTSAAATPETMFHLASVSKPFVATAIVSLATGGDSGGRLFDLDAPITDWVPEFSLADGRAEEVTARGLLSHTSGLPDVTEYGWHDPQLGDDALSEFARSLSGWRLQAEPGTSFSYSNAGFELLGLVLSRVMDTTFEDAVRQRVLIPLGMRNSTFLRSEVPEHLAASPHVGMPLTVLDGAYPYTRRHAPSSTLHSNVDELCRWMVAHFEPAEPGTDGPAGPWARLDPGLVDQMRQPVAPVGRPPWEEAQALGWAVGSYRGHHVLSHSGADPGFGSKLVLVPDRRTGVVVLANSNTGHTGSIAAAALDILFTDLPLSALSEVAPDEPGEGVAQLRTLLPPITRPLADAITTAGAAAAHDTFHRLATVEPATFDLDDEVFIDAVWGAIELHHTAAVWPLLRVWTELRPDSSDAWTMTGWAHQVDGRLDQASQNLRRALDLDPDNEEAAQILGNL
ncbi:serine hydrolase [Nocardioides sp.]|uniref:serine hydrolase n=1 Tax=Nocardioides sp. TaxID=35761 RepID=UPI002ECFB33F